MITRMTGTLTAVTDDEARLEIGPFEYAVMVPESVRRQLQMRVGQELTLHISEYFEGNNSGTRLIPRKVGFLHDFELEFFDLFCTVDKVGVKKALKAMARPVKEIAEAITRQDSRWLSTLPGIGVATAESMVATLRKKVLNFAVLKAPTEVEVAADDGPKKRVKKAVEPSGPPAPSLDAQLIDDVYQALMVMGLTPVEARSKLDGVLTAGKPFATLDEALQMIYARG